MGRLLGRVDTVISRTGYTGEDGFEVIVGGAAAAGDLGGPAGIGQAARHHPVRPRRARHAPARGRDAAVRPRADRGDRPVSRPASAGPSSSTRAISSAATRWCSAKEHPPLARVGLILEGKRIARQGATVLSGDREVGLVTSGTFSPTLQASLAMALVAPDAAAIGTAAVGRRPRTPRAGPRRQAAVLQTAGHCTRGELSIRDAALRAVRIDPPTPRGIHRWIPKSLRFTPTHEWVSLEGDVATVGISKFAVDQLTDLIMIELPAVGTTLAAGKSFGEVESVKASATCMPRSPARSSRSTTRWPATSSSSPTTLTTRAG